MTTAVDFPDMVEIAAQVPRGSRNMYEWGEHAGIIRLDRAPRGRAP